MIKHCRGWGKILIMILFYRTWGKKIVITMIFLFENLKFFNNAELYVYE